jgi:PPK2 family polyphosphate:nucleotide phosphotransferase
MASDRFLAPAESPYLVPFDGSFRVEDAPTRPPKEERKQKQKHKDALEELTERMGELQERLYADDRWALLLVFQAMDAAGKDGTIRAVMTGINPAGCQVFSFKKPSSEELDHDFLWRVTKCLPERGRIGIFNRSHYEEVLAVRVHPEYLAAQRLPGDPEADEDFWRERYEAIRSMERHLARSGTAIVKFWLDVSRDEQKERFLARIDEPESRWKFNARDVEERRHWDAYMRAYEDALNATSRPFAPWYAIPADDKPFMRRTVADIVVRTLERMGPRFPEVAPEQAEHMRELRRALAEGEL